MGGKCALASASGPVYSDDGAMAFGSRRLGRLRCFVCLAHSAVLSYSDLYFREGGRLPKGFLLSLNLSKVLAGLPELPADLPANLPAGLPDLAKGFLP